MTTRLGFLERSLLTVCGCRGLAAAARGAPQLRVEDDRRLADESRRFESRDPWKRRGLGRNGRLARDTGTRWTVDHHKEDRCGGHLFITVLAYRCVQFLRMTPKVAGIDESWATRREILAAQLRVTASFRPRDGRTLKVRKATGAEPELMAICRAPGINPAPGGTRKPIN